MGTHTLSAVTFDEVRAVSPALEKYTHDTIVDDLWQRAGLSRRDRSIVTAAALIARSQTIGMSHYFSQALDCGVKPSELSEIVFHLAYYSGWPNAMQAVAILNDLFAQRAIGPDQLPEVSPALLPLDEVSEAKRASTVEQTWAKWLRHSFNTRRTCSSATCGCVRASRLGTGVSSLSAH